MKVLLPSSTLTRFARATSLQSAVVGLTTLALIVPLTSNCFGQFTASDSAKPDQGHSILVREGEQLDAVEPHQSGSSPKPYSTRQQTADTGAAQAHATRAVTSDTAGGGFISSNSQPDRVERPGSQAKSLSANSLRPADFSAGQSSAFTASQTPAFTARQAPATKSNKAIAPLPTERRTSPPQQARTNSDVIVDRSVAPASFAAPVQSFQNQSRRSFQSLQPRQNAGQENRYNSRGNQAAQSAPQRQGNRSPKKTSSSAKVLISRFGFNASQDNSDNLVPLRLADVLNQGQMRANRSQLIEQYWETFDDWAQSVSAKQHRDWVNGLRVSKSTDQSTVGVAKSNAENEVTSGRIQLGKSQAKLKSILGSTASIVPADLPTVTMVKTNFQAFKERGLIPARLEGIDQTLNDLHDLVLSRADTVLMAERAAEQVEGYYRSNQATIEQLLGAGRAWRSAEADFVSSTIEYNKAYADYALALPYGQAPVEQVVAMLVVPANASSSAAAPYAGGNAQQAQLSPTPSQPAFSSRAVPQRRRATPQSGQDSRVRAASNGFGRSSAPQSPTQRPMPDFTESHNASAAAASFASPKPPEFRPNSVASPRPDTVAPQQFNSAASQRPNAAFQQRPVAASRQEVRPSSTSFGGGSAGPSIAAGARDKVSAATSGFEFGNRSASQPAVKPVARPAAQPVARPVARPVRQPVVQPVSQPATEPVSQPVARSPVTPSASSFGSGKPAAHGFSDVSASRSSDSFGSRASNGLKQRSTDLFSNRPAAVKPPVKPADPFGVSGSATKVTPAGSSTSGGFAR